MNTSFVSPVLVNKISFSFSKRDFTFDICGKVFIIQHDNKNYLHVIFIRMVGCCCEDDYSVRVKFFTFESDSLCT